MSIYFRITAYHPEKDISVILDSNGYFEKLWQFSAFLVERGFKILEVGADYKFQDGNLAKIPENKTNILCRAAEKGKPTKDGDRMIVNGKHYIPDGLGVEA